MSAPDEYDHFTIRSLMIDLPPLTTVSSTACVREALEKMSANDYSQLPVLEDDRCIGSVTMDSVSKRLVELDRKGGKPRLNEIMDWPVRRFLDEKPRYVGADDDLLNHLEWIIMKGFVIVGEARKPDAVVTNYDLACFLNNKTEAFLLLREMETALRFIIRRRLKNEGMEKALASVKTPDGSRPTALDELTLDGLRQIICMRENWVQFHDIFGDREKISERLAAVCQLRNEIFHFRGDLARSGFHHTKNTRDLILKLASNLKRTS